jgi:hypothetical protein
MDQSEYDRQSDSVRSLGAKDDVVTVQNSQATLTQAAPVAVLKKIAYGYSHTGTGKKRLSAAESQEMARRCLLAMGVKTWAPKQSFKD